MTDTAPEEGVQREKGVETQACPTCGADLKVNQNADGSISPERCQNCYPEDIVESADADNSEAAARLEQNQEQAPADDQSTYGGDDSDSNNA